MVLAVVVFLVGMYGLVADAQLTEPKAISQAVAGVLPGTIPPNLAPSYGMKLNVMGNAFVLGSFVHTEGSQRLVVSVCHAVASRQSLYSQARNLSARELKELQSKPTKIVNTAIEVKVNGSTLSAQEGIVTTQSGVVVREVFVDLGADTVVLFSAHQEHFDQATMNAFLKAVHKPNATPAVPEKTIKTTK